MQRALVALTLNLTLLTGCTWLPGMGGAGTGSAMGSGAMGPTLKDARLEANTAQPGQTVTISGVPEALGEVTGTLTPMDGGAPLEAMIRRENASTVTLGVPVAAQGPDKSADVEVTLTAGAQSSPKLKLRILALPPVDPQSMRKLGQNALVAPILVAAAAGIAIDHAALGGDLSVLPEQLLPLAMVHHVLSDPTNPDSLRAFLDDTAPSVAEDPAAADTLKRLMQSSGLIETLAAYNVSRATSAQKTPYRTFGGYFVDRGTTTAGIDLRLPLSPEVLSVLLHQQRLVADTTNEFWYKALAYQFDTVAMATGFRHPPLGLPLTVWKFTLDLMNALQTGLLPAGYKGGFDAPLFFVPPERDKEGRYVPYPIVRFDQTLSEDGVGEWSNARVTPVSSGLEVDVLFALNGLLLARNLRQTETKEILKLSLEKVRQLTHQFKMDKAVVWEMSNNKVALTQIFGDDVIPTKLKLPPNDYRPVDVTKYCSIYQATPNNLRTVPGNRQRFTFLRGTKGILKLGLFSDGLYLGEPLPQAGGAIAGGAHVVQHVCPL